jgi:hypothetical protein
MRSLAQPGQDSGYSYQGLALSSVAGAGEHLQGLFHEFLRNGPGSGVTVSDDGGRHRRGASYLYEDVTILSIHSLMRRMLTSIDQS